MMRIAQVVRLRPVFHHRLVTTTPVSCGPSQKQQKPKQKQKQKQKKNHLPYSSSLSSLDFESRGLRLLQTPDTIIQESNIGSDSDDNKSRNQKKRESQRAFQWGLELATFSIPQIKLIVRAASLEQEVLDAIMLVKRLGPDVREGKRRQFNYIGRLLREVQPELMNELIQATKDGDQSKLQELSGGRTCTTGEDEEDREETEYEEEEGIFIAVASRWFDGLIEKDSDVTKEVYSIHNVEFDRQELQKLVRRVYNIQCHPLTQENEAALAGPKKSLLRFLRSLAKQMEYDY